MNDEDKTIGVESQVALDQHVKGKSKSEQEVGKSAEEYKGRKSTQELVMAVKVYSPFRDYFDGQAFSISAENLTGPFDVLPKHHSFISLLIACEIVIRTPKEVSGEPIKIKIGGGLMHVKANQVIVFLDV